MLVMSNEIVGSFTVVLFGWAIDFKGNNAKSNAATNNLMSLFIFLWFVC